MRPLSAAELLDVWEQGQGVAPVPRALQLLAAACPEESPTALAALSVGQRDARLLRLRAWSFGPRLESVVPCPACGEQLELDFAAADVLVESEVPDGPFEVTHDGYTVTFRLPTSQDLLAVATLPENRARRHLLARCLLAAQRDGAPVPTTDLPPPVLDAVVAGMEARDPQADVTLALACPACGHEWEALLDIASFFWAEIEAWARRTLYEVHGLARAYGWHEADVLAMSARRRQLYLEMASG